MSRHRKAFQKFREEVSGIEGVDEVYLFGSVARGSYGVNSDVDIFVKASEDLRHELEEIAFEVSLEENVSVTVIVKDSMDNALGEKVLEEGVTSVKS